MFVPLILQAVPFTVKAVMSQAERGVRDYPVAGRKRNPRSRRGAKFL